MNRREFVATAFAMSCAKSVLGVVGLLESKIGMCTFSCHRHWAALREKNLSFKTKFHNGPTYFEYTRSLGGDGVQTGLTGLSEDQLVAFRKRLESTNGYFESDIRLPSHEDELAAFEVEVKRAVTAGATVARACLSGQRRYETWQSRKEFDVFHAQALVKLKWIEPILARHRFRVAIENHKDLTSSELVAILKTLDSEWIGVNVDTGNNIALMEDPYQTIETLAPYAMSIHFKDMAVQRHPRGFLLSEVPCGAGSLDLHRIANTLAQANPRLHFNLEMATRDPLMIPCNEDSYWATFPDRRSSALPTMMQFIEANPIQSDPPTIQNKSIEEQVIEEERNNLVSLVWMNRHVRTTGNP